MKPPFWHADFGNHWLETLHEVEGLVGVSYLPAAPGPLILLCSIIVLVCLLLLKTWQRWRAKTYQRQALARLDLIEAELDRGELAGLCELNAILKRCALKLSGRTQVASLSGIAWRQYLVPDETLLRPEDLNAEDIHQLENWAYGEPKVANQAALILPKMRRWITS